MDRPAYGQTAKHYSLLMKPGIIMGNIITTSAGFFLASRGNIHFLLFFQTLIGLALVIGSACVLNNFIDRESDRKMKRTKQRALATGEISRYGAIVFAVLLLSIGVTALVQWTNPLTLALALVGFFTYVLLYSISKYYSIHGTLIGSIAGAMPPLIGYTAVTNRIDLPAIILFVMLILWQMPHFYSITIYRLDDYRNASIPILPLEKGMRRTKTEMMLYIIAFIAVSSLLTFLNYTSTPFLIVATFLSLIWLGISIQGFFAKNDCKWARQMFVVSLIVVLGMCVILPLTVNNL